MTKVYMADVAVLDDSRIFEAFYRKMPSYRKEKTDACRLTEDKKRSLGVGALLMLAQKEFGFEELINMAPEAGENGKPYFKDSSFHFNLSHSGSAVMCIAADHEVGCDVEWARRSDAGHDIENMRRRDIGHDAGNIFRCDVSRIADRFFFGDEKEFVFSADTEDEKRSRFFRLWTLKESFLKVTGRGLSLPLQNFSVVPRVDGTYAFNLKSDNASCPSGNLSANAAYSFFEFDYSPEYCCSCCVKDGGCEKPDFVIKDLTGDSI